MRKKTAKDVVDLAMRITENQEATGAARRKASTFGSVSFSMSKPETNADVEDKIIRNLDEMLDEYKDARGSLSSYNSDAQRKVQVFFEATFSHILPKNETIKEKILDSKLAERRQNIAQITTNLSTALDNEPTHEGKRWALLNFVLNNSALADKILNDQPDHFSDAGLEEIVTRIKEVKIINETGHDNPISLAQKMKNLSLDIQDGTVKVPGDMDTFMNFANMLKTVKETKLLLTNPSLYASFMDTLNDLINPQTTFPQPKSEEDKINHKLNPRVTKAELNELRELILKVAPSAKAKARLKH